jgi:hypothetical protein
LLFQKKVALCFVRLEEFFSCHPIDSYNSSKQQLTRQVYYYAVAPAESDCQDFCCSKGKAKIIICGFKNWVKNQIPWRRLEEFGTCGGDPSNFDYKAVSKSLFEASEISKQRLLFVPEGFDRLAAAAGFFLKQPQKNDDTEFLGRVFLDPNAYRLPDRYDNWWRLQHEQK